MRKPSAVLPALVSQLRFSADFAISGGLATIALSDKPLIREHLDALADGAVGLAPCSTGGSSGEPIALLIPLERIPAMMWRPNGETTLVGNVDIGDREIVLWGSPIELGDEGRVKLLRDMLMRTKLLPAFAHVQAKR